MANRFVVPLNVTADDVALLREVLDWAAEKVDKKEKLDKQLAGIERDVEIVPPPSKWSALLPVYVGGCSEEIVRNGYEKA